MYDYAWSMYTVLSVYINKILLPETVKDVSANVAVFAFYLFHIAA